MSGPRDEAPGTAPAEAPAHRSRWRRFSPSMGWRAFWSEIVIVVLGVAIALAANEAVQEWNWRNKVKDAEVRLQGDIAWAFLWAAEKYASQPCVDAQLAALARKILESADTLEPVPVQTSNGPQKVVRFPNRPYRFPTWDALIADGTANHFSPPRQAFLGRLSNSMAGSYGVEIQTRGMLGRLLLLRDPIALDPVVRAELLTRIGEVRSITSFEALNAQQRMRLIADNGSAPAEEVVERFLNASGERQAGAEFSGMATYCKAGGYPFADWRDYRKITVNTGLVPGMEVR
jgi:hypothetical protein